jgi:hypothetical protein
MRGLHHHRAARIAVVAGLLVGGIAGTTGVVVGASAIAQSAPATPRAVIEATHLPPLFTLPGEPVALSFDVHCAPAGVEDPEQACQTVGSVFAREGTAVRFASFRSRSTARTGSVSSGRPSRDPSQQAPTASSTTR